MGPTTMRRLEPVRVTTTDPDLAEARFTAAFPSLELEIAGAAGSFGLDHHRVGDDRMAVNRLKVSGAARATGSIEPTIAVARLLDGRFDLDYAGTRIDTRSPYLRPAGRSTAVMEDMTVELIELDPVAFDTAAQHHLAGSGRVLRPIAADGAGPVGPTSGAAWRGIAGAIAAIAFDPDAFGSPLVRAGVFELAVTGMLATFALSAAAGAAAGADVPSAPVRRALAYIDAHFAEPIDSTSIDEAARVPLRTLQAAFRGRLGQSPMQHVRLRRMEAARAELLDGDPADGVSVAVVARRWGFAHLARFAGQYRRTYGEYPSETLRR